MGKRVTDRPADSMVEGSGLASERGSWRVGGFTAPGFELLTEEFRRNQTERGDVGSAFAVYLGSEVVIDLWGGLADPHRGKAWDEDTIVGIFSGSKGMVAVCLLLLIDRALLDLDAPVASYWPEFGAHDKGGILVRHVVSHQAGLPGLDTPVTADEATDSLRMAALLAEQSPIAPPGASLYYHALTFGWLCGELVRRIDGRTIGRFFHDEVAERLQLDAWIGLPAEEEHRVALLERAEGFGSQKRDREASEGADHLAWSIWENPERFSANTLPANTRRWRAAEVPASNGVANARAMARLYGCLANGGEIDGIRLLRPETIELGTTCLSRGFEPYLDKDLAFGVGFALPAQVGGIGTAREFGHPGSGGSAHGAWREYGAGFSYVTNTLHEQSEADPRSTSLLEALRGVLDIRESALARSERRGR